MEIGIGLIYRVTKDGLGWIWRYITRNKRSLTQADRVNRRVKWQGEFKSRLSERRQNGLPVDVTIRDVQRVDDYPETERRWGISSRLNSPVMKLRFDQSVSGATMMMITSMAGLPSMFATMAIARAASN